MLNKAKKAIETPLITTNLSMKAFLKCPGGKSSLLPVLDTYLPALKDKKNIKYIEPFLGGGSLLLHMVNKGVVDPKNCYINELNHDTYHAWNNVLSKEENFNRLISELDKCKEKNSKTFFYNTRKTYKTSIDMYVATQVAKFIYLNKTCFNGLIRYNKSGEFNAPYGDYKNPRIYDLENLKLINSKLFTIAEDKTSKERQMFNLDFEDFFKELFSRKNLIDEDTFVYLDPPYLPTSITSNFTSYTKDGFNQYDHYRIRTVMDYLTKLGAKVMLSNSDTPLTREIFKDYVIIEVSNIRNIAAKSGSRGKTRELLILNYFDK